MLKDLIKQINSMDKIEKIVIPAEELGKVTVNLKCTQRNCQAVFLSSSNLAMHLHKRHNIKNNFLDKKTTKIEYKCPIDSCKYSKNGDNFFKKSTLLKQHYLKVHAAKDFVCEQCDKGFPTAAAKKYHKENSCGKTFNCSCGIAYASKEALLTHAKRKQHQMIKEEQAPQIAVANAEVGKIRLLAAIALSELSKPITKNIGIQTDEIEVARPKRKSLSPARAIGNNTGPAKITKRKQSIHTQTNSLKKPKTSTETQTSIAMVQKSKRNKKHIETQTSKKKQKCIETQTFDNEFKKANLTEIDCDSNQSMMDQSILNDTDVWLNQKSTQTCPLFSFKSFNEFERFQTSETQTEMFNDDFLGDDCDTNFTLCSNIETQTCGVLDEMMQSDMYTQTCNELLLDFAHIETQTWPDN